MQEKSNTAFTLKSCTMVAILIYRSVRWQVEVLVMAIIHAINNVPKCVSSHCVFYFNAGLLPLYTRADFARKTVISNSIPITSLTGNIIAIYNHYLALVYRYTDEGRTMHDCGTIIKTVVSQALKKLKRYHAAC